MALVRWDPVREMEDMFSRYARTIGWPSLGGQETMATAEWVPRVDIAETDTAYVIKAEIPGVKKEDVKITVDDGVLTISGKREEEKEDKSKRFHRVERMYGTFSRAFTLPDNVDESKIDAEFKDGILTLTIPRPRRRNRGPWRSRCTSWVRTPTSPGGRFAAVAQTTGCRKSFALETDQDRSALARPGNAK